VAFPKDGKPFVKVFPDNTVFVSTVLAERKWFMHRCKCLSVIPGITFVAQVYVPLKFIDYTMLIYKKQLSAEFVIGKFCHVDKF